MIASDAATNENRPGVGAGFENLTTEKLGISPGGLLIRSGGAKPMRNNRFQKKLSIRANVSRNKTQPVKR